MSKVSLYDHSRHRTIELENSSTITVGRGFFECHDKRVSRKHGEIKVLEAKIKIKACHANPIFYKISGTNQNQILAKDNEIELKNLDKFSLLPNSEYEYEIKILQEGQETSNSSENGSVAASSSTFMRIRNATEINANLEAGNCPLSLSQIERGRVSLNPDEGSRDGEDLDRTPSPDALVPPPDFVPPSQSRKRSNEGTAGDISKRSRLSDDAVAADSSASNTDAPTTSENASNPPAVTIKPEPSSTAIKPDPDAVPTSSTPAVSSSSTAPTVKPDPDGPSDSTTPAVKTEPTSNSSEKNPPAPGLRQSCEFGIRCYRNTADHHRAFAHPNDPDYRRPNYPPAPAETPDCPWGAACYRRNPDHFRVLRHPPANVYSTHPPAPAAPPQPQPPPPAPRQPRRARNNRDTSDEDDEDNEDDILDFDDSEEDQDFNPDNFEDDESDHLEDDEENNLEE